jgi:vacuolar-type H+-ATPase subunit C/Vma6
MERLTEAGSVEALIAELARTSYRQAVESALARYSGLECVSAALRDDLEFTLAKISRFYRGRAGEMVEIVLRAYDVRNLKAILRGLSGRAMPGEIMNSVLPVGTLSRAIMSELSQAGDPRAAIDLLATLALPFAQPLLELRGERPGASTTEMELRLDQWHFRRALNELHRKRQRRSSLFAGLQLEADVINLLTVIRLVSAPEERAFLREWLGTMDVSRIFVGPGKLPFNLLARAAAEDTPAEAVEVLAGTGLEAPLKAGLEEHAATGRLSAFEKQLRQHYLDWSAGLIGKDPLGIGVVSGYLALKSTDVSNVGWIAQAIHLGLTTTAMRRELVYAG